MHEGSSPSRVLNKSDSHYGEKEGEGGGGGGEDAGDYDKYGMPSSPLSTYLDANAAYHYVQNNQANLNLVRTAMHALTLTLQNYPSPLIMQSYTRLSPLRHSPLLPSTPRYPLLVLQLCTYVDTTQHALHPRITPIAHTGSLPPRPPFPLLPPLPPSPPLFLFPTARSRLRFEHYGWLL